MCHLHPGKLSPIFSKEESVDYLTPTYHRTFLIAIEQFLDKKWIIEHKIYVFLIARFDLIKEINLIVTSIISASALSINT